MREIVESVLIFLEGVWEVTKFSLKWGALILFGSLSWPILILWSVGMQARERTVSPDVWIAICLGIFGWMFGGAVLLSYFGGS